jgi:hypothetical protein
LDIISIILNSKEDSNLNFNISVSKGKTFDACRRKFKFCYIEKLPRIDRDFHIFGKFLHFCLEYFHKHMIEQQNLGKKALAEQKMTSQNLSVQNIQLMN